MTRRKMDTNRQEPQFGYNSNRQTPYFDEPRAAVSNRAAVRRRGGRRPLLPLFLVGAVIILFGGFLCISYIKGPKLVAGQLPLIQADTTPLKVKPDKPGGAEIPFQDTTVYDDLNQGKQKHAQQVEHLLAQPEQPLPVVPPASVPEATVQTAQPAEATPVPSQQEQTLAPPAPAPPQASTEDAVPAITQDNEAALAPEPVPQQPASPQPPTGDKLLPPPPAAPLPAVATVKPSAKPAVVTPTVKPKPTAPSPTATRNSTIQLGSFQDEGAAKTEWQRLKSRYSDQLSTLSPIIQRVDLGEKGIWFRLRAGPLTADKAKTTCTALTQAKAPCIVAAH